MTDELTTDLATISALRVISRGSVMRYKGAHRPPTPEIAKALNVDAVVEGSVMRLGNKVRITAQLIDAPADRHLWAKSYERDSRDVLALQDEVALAIAGEINVELTPREQARFANSRTVDPQAHDAYLKGRYFLSSYSEGRVKKAIEQFEEAIKADPNFALAYTGLADAFYFPQYYIGWTDMEAGRFSEAIPALEKARTMDSSAFVAGWLGYAYAAAGERAKAETMIAGLNRMSSRQWVSRYCPALIYLGLGDKRRAVEELEKAYEDRSQWLLFLKVDRIFDPLRSDPQFIALLKKVGLDD